METIVGTQIGTQKYIKNRYPHKKIPIVPKNPIYITININGIYMVAKPPCSI